MGKRFSPDISEAFNNAFKQNVQPIIDENTKLKQTLSQIDYYKRTETILKNFKFLKEQSEKIKLDKNVLNDIKDKKLNELMNDIFLKEDKSVEEIILESQKRTKIFVEFVEQIFNKYIKERKNLQEDSIKNKKEIRKVIILEKYYLNNEFEQKEFIEEYNTTAPTFRNDNKELLEEMKVLIYGIDGLNVI